MAPEKFKRKLTAILSADVKGYSRLMGEDEEGTIRTLNAYLEVINGFIYRHQGRVVTTAGDSVLAEFPSVVDAVRCAVGIQEELKDRNKELPEEKRMEFRIGVNLGDVVEEGGNILGDGVNVAARVESLADGGGICISGTVYDQIKNKLAFSYDYVGEQAVKNIKGPVRVYKVRMGPEVAPEKLGVEKKPVGKRLSKSALAIMTVVVIAGAVILYQFVLRPSPSKTEVASKEKMAFPLPDMPSIAVLPFANMTGDAKQEPFCDGVTESIITSLSKVPRLFVIARNSTFTYKGKPTNVKKVSEELGVRYVLEGSVQRSGDRVRITAQLIDALTGNHIWAEQYARDLKDIFAVQDEVTLKVVKAMQLKLTEGEAAVLIYEWKGSQNLDCYLKALEGIKYVERNNIEDNSTARRLANETLALCPDHVIALLVLAATHHMDFFNGTTRSPGESLQKAIHLTQKAISIDDNYAYAHGYLGYLYNLKGEHDKAIAEGEKAITLNPSGADVHAWMGGILLSSGKPEEALPLLQKAIRLNPFAPTWYFNIQGVAYRLTGRFEESVSAYKKALQRSPDNMLAHLGLAGTYSMMGREKEAHAEAAEVMRVNPKFSLDYYEKTHPIRDESATENYIDALRKAGLK